MKISDVPFNQLVGIREDTNAAGQRLVVLEPTNDHFNHLQTLHAGVIFSVAEAASGVCLIETFGDLAADVVAVLRSSEVKYRHPATSRITAHGSIQPAATDKFRQRFTDRGRATVDVNVTVSQENESVLKGTFTWLASRR